MKLKLSILDQSPIVEHATAEHALQNSIKLATLADQLGYESILYSEHHGVEAYGSSSPEILAAIVLAKTNRIKVGTGGIMLRNYSAFKIAEWSKMLATLFPNRFVLGLGKAPGGLKDAVMALNNHKPAIINDLNKKVDEIISYIQEKESVYRGLVAQPGGVVALLEILWLGSGVKSAKEAAERGIGYSMGEFISDGSGDEAFHTYKTYFSNNGYAAAPLFQVALSVSVASTIEKARKNAYGMVYQFLQSRALLAPNALLSTEKVERLIKESKDRDLFYSLLDKVILGTPNTIGGQLENKAKQYHTDNLLLLCNMSDEEDRLFTYKSMINNIS